MSSKPDTAHSIASGDMKGEPGVFTHGSTMRHVLVMSSTGAAGLIAIFFVDLANLFYISLLGQQELAAAVGYASTLMFFNISFSIGLTVAASALTGRAFGARDVRAAHRTGAASLIYTLIANIALVALLFPFISPAMSALGATGRTHEIAVHFMQIVLPSTPMMALGMCASGLLRARGDARRAMYVTLSSGLSAAIIDPVLIFGLDLGITGAAIAVVLVRFMFMAVGFHGTWIVHKMLEMPSRAVLWTTLRPFLGIAGPAVLTQIATPVGNAYVTSVIAGFGDDAVAGWAIVGRVTPLAFAAIFSLSGSVGPILSQNLGARRFDRVSGAMRDALTFAGIYVLAMWAVLALASGTLVQVFGATRNAELLIRVFCYYVAGSFIFTGALFVANSAFNNLGYPLLSTLFNWGRATAGVIPFVHAGEAYGPAGVLAGWGLGSVVFGIAAVVTTFVVLKRLPQRSGEPVPGAVTVPPSSQSPFSSGRAALLTGTPPSAAGSKDQE